MSWIMSRLKEKSTLSVLLTLGLGVCGVKLSPEHTVSIVSVVVALLSAIGIVTPERRSNDDDDDLSVSHGA